MPKIILLDEATSNQIAAGEVVERPASVVKELAENSLDAGASRISVEIKAGGLEEIKVADNGCGMDETDAATAFQRHATSKISSVSDLEGLSSLGFRGEALPSIASVSKTVLITRPPGAASGTRLEVQGGHILSVSPAGCPAGTSVTVRELFFNTPARLKYIKSRSTESGHAGDTVLRLALARPDVAFKFTADGRAGLQTPGGGDLLGALAAAYGPDLAREMLPLENSEEQIAVGGLIAPPAVSRSSKRQITVVVNGRYVTSHLVNSALIDGYGSLLPGGRFPLAVVLLQMDPGILDVNVHPAKMAVRISGEGRVYNLVRRTVAAVLRTGRVIPAVSFPAAGSRPEEVVSPEHGAGLTLPLHRAESTKIPGYPRPAGESLHFREEGETVSVTGLNLPDAGGRDLLETAYPIGFLPPAYILAGSSSGLLIIDHHAAHERVLYEKFLSLLAGDRVESQILLVPAVVQLSPREYQAAGDNLEILASLGIGASSFGTGSLLVREIPAGLPDIPAEDLVRDLLESLIDPGGRPGREGLARRMAASTACKAAVKAGERSTLEEARALIRDLAQAEAPYTCPHGRPTVISIGEQEIRARFKRT